MKNVDVIVDLQFGSTGKGLLAGFLGKRNGYDTYVTSNAPNAGHTYVESDGTRWVMRQLPVGVVLPSAKTVLIGPGAVIDPGVLRGEIELVSAAREAMGRGAMPEILIHPHAAVVTRQALEAEKSMVKIGSTMKGAGAALVAKIARDPDDMAVAREALRGTYLTKYVCSPEQYDFALDQSTKVLVEGSQGYSLGISSGFYPYTTSRECTPAQILSDCLVPWTRVNKVIGTMRMHPIRVANRYDAQGSMIGYSGPCYPDQVETSWEELGVPEEKTTVTQLRRRVFTFSEMQIRRAVRLCQPAEVFLNFANYDQNLAPKIATLVNSIMSETLDVDHAGVRYLGFGPSESDVRMANNQYTMDLDGTGKRIPS